MEELIKIKNQIHIKDEKEKYEDELIKIFCKNLISNLEIINKYMKVLR